MKICNATGNGFRWSNYDDKCARLYDENDNRIASLTYKYCGYWDVDLVPAVIGCQFGIEAATIAEAEWKATVCINKLCVKKINALCAIRDRLPSIHELAEKVFKYKEVEVTDEDCNNRS